MPFPREREGASQTSWEERRKWADDWTAQYSPWDRSAAELGPASAGSMALPPILTGLGAALDFLSISP